MLLLRLVPPPTARGLFAHKPNPNSFPHPRPHHLFPHSSKEIAPTDDVYFHHRHRDNFLPPPPPFAFTQARQHPSPLHLLATPPVRRYRDPDMNFARDMMPPPVAIFPGMRSKSRRHHTTINAPDNHVTFMQDRDTDPSFEPCADNPFERCSPMFPYAMDFDRRHGHPSGFEASLPALGHNHAPRLTDSARSETAIAEEATKAHCLLPLTAGHCKAAMPRWGFTLDTGTCGDDVVVITSTVYETPTRAESTTPSPTTPPPAPLAGGESHSIKTASSSGVGAAPQPSNVWRLDGAGSTLTDGVPATVFVTGLGLVALLVTAVCAFVVVRIFRKSRGNKKELVIGNILKTWPIDVPNICTDDQKRSTNTPRDTTATSPAV
ncbi:hypothetical protein NP493_118g04024 [Ridgeia piscesae]|uniref:Uncharacterized protein n=1 Tax=Ridgeia piscesae TaxID=27915 RepID=A0AAD9P6F3_RIDPI|nr:hypothetical protein NP493_118g04024 [Ridgeia piscesae]